MKITTQKSPKKIIAIRSRDDVLREFVAGEKVQITAKIGARYKVTQAKEEDGSGETEAPLTNVVASRNQDDLRLVYADKSEIVIEKFFEVCKGESCGIDLPSANGNSYHIGAGNTAGYNTANGETVIYAWGEAGQMQHLLQKQGFANLDVNGVGHDGVYLNYIPPNNNSAYIIGGLALLGAAAIGIAAGSGGGSSGSAASSSTPQSTSQDTWLEGSVVAGPVIQGHGLRVTAYRADGSILATDVLNSSGQFRLQIINYAGPVLVRVSDLDSGNDYFDEGTNAPKDLTLDLRAATVVERNTTVYVNLNILTEYAVRSLGLAGGDGGNSSTTIGNLTNDQVTAANLRVGQAVGLTTQDLVTGTAPIAVIDTQGINNPLQNYYGQLLAALSGAETGPKTTNDVLNDMASNGISQVVTGGAQNVPQLGNVNWTLDTTAPNAPTVILGTGVGNGATTAEATANTGVINVSGESGASIAVTFTRGSNTVTKTVTGTGTAQAVTLTSSDLATLGDGTISVSATATDVAGNASSAGTASFILDTSAPNAPIVSSAALTNDTTPVISGTAETGSTVHVTVGGATYNVTATGGNWSIDTGAATPTSGTFTALSDGNNSVNATATDAAGNTSPVATQTLVVNTVAPTATFVAPQDATTGIGISGMLTLQFSTDVYGTGASNIRIKKVSDNSTVATLNAADAVISGSGSTTTVKVAYAGLSAGTAYYVTIAAGAFVDAAGNLYAGELQSGTAGWDFVTGDPVIGINAMAVDNHVNATENASPITLTGQISSTVGASVLSTYNASGITVTLTPQSGSPITLSPVSYNSGTGVWSATIPANTLANINYVVSVSATGTTYPNLATSNNLYVDTTAPNPPVVSSTTLTNDTSPVISGTAEVGSTVHVTVGGATYNVTAIGGNWSVDTGTATPASGSFTALSSGNNSVSVTATDAAGNTSTAATQTLVVDTSAPNVPTLALGTGVANGATAAEATAGTGVVTVSGESGASIAVTFTRGSNTVTKTVTGTGSAQAIVLSSGDLTTLGDGSISVSAIVTDAAGNASSAGNTSFTLDTIAPTTPGTAPTTASLPGNNTPAFAVGVGLTDTPNLYVDGAPVSSTYNSVSGTLTPTSALTDATHSITYTLTDTAGNASGSSPSLSFTVDTTAPSAPTLALGTSVANGATSAEATAGTGVVTVSGESGASIAVTFTNGANSVTKTVTGTGSAQAVVLSSGDLTTLGNGTISVSATATDPAGNASSAGSTSFTLDTSTPGAPVVSSAALTNDTTPLISGTAESGSTVHVTVGGATYNVTATGGNWSVDTGTATPASGSFTALTAGNNSVSVTATDAAGNTSTAATQTLVVDTTAPNTPVVSSASLTNDTTPVISGTAESDSTVHVTVGGATYNVTATGGNWSVDTGTATPASGSFTALTTGNNSVSVTATDTAGNTSTAATQTLVVDTTPPSAPTLALGTGVAGGATTAEATAGTGVVTVSGESGASIAVIFSNGGSTVTKTVTGTGSAQAVVLSSGDLTTLGNGTISVSAIATDAAGNASSADSTSFTLDTSAPNTPVVSSSALTNDTTPVISGTAESGSTVNVTVGGATYSVTATGGNWSVDTGSATAASGTFTALSSGNNSVSVTATDAAGNTSTAATQTLMVDTTPPSAPTLALGTGVANGATAAEAMAGTGVVTVSGESGASIAVTFTHGANSVTKTVTGTGSAQAIVLSSGDLTALGNGTISVSAIATDTAGNASSAGTTSFTLDTSAPIAPVVSSAALTNDTDPVISGTAESGSTVSVTVGGATYSVAADGSGNWSVNTGSASPASGSFTQLSSGNNTVSVTATDAAGNTSTAATQTLVVDTTPPSAPTLALGTGVAGGATAAEATAGTGVVTVSGESGASIAVTFSNGGSTVTKTVTGTGSAQAVVLSSSDLTTLGNGTITVSATATDPAGNASSAGTTSFTLDTIAPTSVALSTTNVLDVSTGTNTSIATLSGTDANSLSYALITGNGTNDHDNSSFNISGANLRTNATLTPGTYQLYVAATDSAGNTTNQALSVTVSVNSAPVISTPTAISYTDTATTDTFINSTGTLSATDPDNNAIASYGISGGTNASNTIGGITYNVSKAGSYGTLYLKSTDGSYVYVPNASAINAQTSSVSETFTVQATDNNSTAAATGSAVLTINVTGVNDTPTDVTISANSVNQSGGTNAVVGALSTVDADTAQPQTYTLVSGSGDTNNALFNISGGSLRINDAAAVAAGTYSVRVQTNDGTSTFAKALTINVVDNVLPGIPVISSTALTSDTTPVISGTAESGSTVHVTVGGATYNVTATGGNWTVDTGTATPASGSFTALTTGNNSVSVTATDAAGNTSTAATQTLVVDTTPPSAPSITTSSGTINSATPTIAGTAEANSTVSIYDGATLLGTTTANGSGAFSFTSPTLTDASHSITAKATDAAGNLSSASSAITLLVDTLTPNAPTISTSGAPINTTTPTITGTAEANSTVTVSVGSATFSVIADSSGVWSVNTGSTPPSSGSFMGLSPGNNSVSVSATDAAGNTSPTTSQTIVVDTTPPSTPTLTLGTGVANGATTAEATAGTGVVTVSGESGASIAVTFTHGSNTIAKTVTGTGSAQPVTLSSSDLATLGDGTITVTATANDSAGNSSSGSTTTFTLDTSAPAPAVISSTSLTNDTSPVISGTAESGSTVNVTVGGATYSITATGGNWSVDTGSATPTSGTFTALNTGNNSVNVTATDAAGNTSTAATQTLVVDITSPNAPSITTSSGTINSATPTIAGTAEANSTVSIYDGSTLLGTITANGSGAFSFTSPTLSNASHSITAKAMDAAGNLSSASSAIALVVDTSAPNAPVVSSSALTNDTSPVINGTAESGSTVNVTVGGATYSITATGGNWSVDTGSATPTSGSFTALSSGNNTVSVTATDAAGNTSTAATQTLVVDTTPPSTPSITTSSGTINSATPTIAGTAEANSTVSIYDGATLLGTITANGSGAFSFTSPTLSNASHSITAKATDAAGNLSSASSAITLVVDTSAPNAPTLALGTGVVNGATAAEATAGTGVVTVSGESGASIAVTFTNGGNSVTKTVTGTGSAQAVTLTSGDLTTLGDGTISVSATATDPAGNASSASTTSFTLDTIAPTTPGAAPTTASLPGNNTPAFVVGVGLTDTPNLYVDGALVNSTYNSVSGTVTPTSTLSDGAHSITYTLTDTAGNTSGSSPSFSFTVDTTAPIAPTLALGTGVANGATSAEATAGTGVVTVSGESGASIAVTFTNGSNSVTKTVTGTGSAQAVVLSSGDLTTLGNGTISVSATATDPAGNSSTAGSTSFRLDTSTPSTPTLALGTGVANGATAAEATAGTGVVTVSGESGASIAVTFTNGSNSVTKTVTGTGSAQAVTLTSGDLTTLGDGSISISATATDAAGNASSAGSTSFTLDTAAPNTPVVSSAALTNDTSPVISGTAESGSTVSVTVGGASYSVTATGGNWSVDTGTATPASGSFTALTTGNNTVSVTAMDAAGNTSSATTQTLVVDILAPIFVSAATSSDGTQVVLTYDGALNATTAATGAFAVTVAGASRTVSSAAVSGSTVVLTLASAVSNGDSVTLDYTDPTGSDDANAIQDAAGNDAISLSAISVTNNVANSSAPPTITALALSGTGGVNNTLNAGDVVTATVSFSAIVNVTNTPQLALNIGTSVVQAAYASGSGTNLLSFTYTIPAGKTDVNGISVSANSLALNGGTILSGSSVAATLTHSAVADQSTLLVDTTAPMFLTAKYTADGTQLVLFYSEILDSTAIPSASSFTAVKQISGSPSVNLGVSAVSITENRVTLTLSTPWDMAASTNPAFTYTSSTGLKDLAGNFAPTQTQRPATSVYSVDNTPPTATSATINNGGTGIQLAFNESLLPSLPDVTAFQITDGTNTYTPVSLSLLSNQVTLGLSQALNLGTTYTVIYSDPSGSNDPWAIQDYFGNDANTFSIGVTVDNVAPNAPSATVGTASFQGATNPAKLTISGVESGATLKIYDGLTDVTSKFTLAQSGPNSYTATPKANMFDGSQSVTFSITQSDWAGNVSPSTSASANFDTTAPVAPTITSASSQTFADQARFSSDFILGGSSLFSSELLDVVINNVHWAAISNSSNAWALHPAGANTPVSGTAVFYTDGVTINSVDVYQYDTYGNKSVAIHQDLYIVI